MRNKKYPVSRKVRKQAVRHLSSLTNFNFSFCREIIKLFKKKSSFDILLRSNYVDVSWLPPGAMDTAGVTHLGKFKDTFEMNFQFFGDFNKDGKDNNTADDSVQRDFPSFTWVFPTGEQETDSSLGMAAVDHQ